MVCILKAFAKRDMFLYYNLTANHYGDQLIIGITSNWPDPEADETVQRLAVSQFVQKYCHKQKPCLLNVERSKRISPLIKEEVKRQSAARFASGLFSIIDK